MKQEKKKIKVLVALSGGVDSSVAAALLVRSKKYEVTAAYMVNYDDKNQESRIRNQGASCWVPDYRDALRVAAHLGIPLIKLDFVKEYKEHVLDYMYKEYAAGRTPNPDVLCNTYVKFGSWLEKARSLGFAFLATGHYAQVKEQKKLTINNEQLTSKRLKSKLLVVNCSLLISNDSNKDQTYFLHQLNQQQLRHTMFPVGKYTKPEVRRLAKKFGLPTADKEESMGICFVGEVPMKEFLQVKIEKKVGQVVTTAGEVVGEHDGLAFYTIGQRHGGVASQKSVKSIKSIKSSENRPLYVVAKRFDLNELVVGYEDDPAMYKMEAGLAEVHWIGGEAPKFPLACEVRLRHRQPLQRATVQLTTNNEQLATVKVIFEQPQRAVTPGQFAVFYRVRRSSGGAKADKGECLGGGVIQ